MSHIAVDLLVIEQLAPDAARGAGVHEDRILGGLNRLWLRCWSKKTDIVTPAGLAGVFGPDRIDAVAGALVEQGLLAPISEGWRVKGADRYLRIQTGRSKGGKAAAGNLKRGNKPGVSREQAGDSSRLLPGLSLSTEHRTLSTEHLDPAGKKPPAEPEKLPDPRHAPLREALLEVYAEETKGSRYGFTGRDAKAVQQLLSLSPDNLEILFKWRTALIASLNPYQSPKTRTLPDLVRDWNHYTAIKAAS